MFNLQEKNQTKHNNLPYKEELISSNLNNYVLQGMIDSGKYGKVYRVKCKENNKIYAAKISKEAINENKEDLFRDIFREVNIISKLNHPSILKFIVYSPFNFKRKLKPVIIMEYASNGSLKKLINHDIANPQDHFLTDTQKLKIIYGIASAMSYLHSHDILHRDLKPDNILLDDFLLPKVGDFGLSKSYAYDMLRETVAGTFKGTAAYMAPEIWSNSEYSKASDVYAFSITVFELMTCSRAYPSKNESQSPYFYSIMGAVMKGERPTLNALVPEAYKWLIVRCWAQDRSVRPSFDEIVAELRTERGYITEKVDEAEFIEYVRFIDEYKTSFDTDKAIIRTNSVRKYNAQCQAKWHISSEGGERKIKVIEASFAKCSRMPYEHMKSMSDASLRVVKEAESGNAERQFEVGLSLIEGRRDFPFDVKNGLNFLKASMEGGNNEAASYYIEMLIKGKVIPSNHEKARQLIDVYFRGDKSASLYLHGKVLKKEKRYAEAAEFFKKSSKLGNADSTFELGNLVGKCRVELNDGENAVSLYKEAISRGHFGAMYKLGVLKYKSSDKQEREDGIALIKKAADNGNRKAMRIYATIVEKEDDDRESESMKYFKRAADEGDGKSLDKFGVKLLNYLRRLPKKESKSEAAAYMKKASDRGFAESMLEYGKLLVDGDIGIPRNEKEGSKYIKNAAILGNVDAIGKYGILLRDGKGVEVDIEEAIKYLKEGIEKGSSIAMNGYAIMLHKGLGVPVDYKEAIKYYKMAIDKGYSYAMNNYALMLKKGQGVPVDYKEAIKYYKMAIDKGESSAMNNYAVMLHYGLGVAVDYKEAIKYYKMAIDKGSSIAMNNYAVMLMNGEGVPVDYDEGIKYYKMAIDKGDSSAIYNYALMLKYGQGVAVNLREAIKYFKMAIDKGISRAMMCYADMFRTGTYIDLKRAVMYYKMAIDKGNPEAMRQYGMMLERGEGVEANIDEAARYYKMALDGYRSEPFKHQSDMMVGYAAMLFNGQGVDRNEEEAISLYKKAVSMSDEDAMLEYGKILLDRKETPEKIKEGVELIRKSAEIGLGEALYEYGRILEEGKFIERNLEESIKYYKKAAERSNRKAKEALERLTHH